MLNEEFAWYPIANKVFAAAWVERNAAEDVLVFVDSDSFFTQEPRALELTDGSVAAVRPVNAKNIGTTGPDDPADAFWAAVHARFGTQPSPTVRTTVSAEEIHGYWNAGLVATRREAGLMRRWQTVLVGLLRWGIAPPGGALNHLDQVALTVALASAETLALDPRYNYPLPQRRRRRRRSPRADSTSSFTCTTSGICTHRDFSIGSDPPLAADCAVTTWLRGHMPLDPVAFATEPRADLSAS